MKAIQMVLVAALVAVLSAIAYDLHRLADDFQLGADLRRSLIALSTKPTETPEQSRERVRREAQQLNESTRHSADVFNESVKQDARKPTQKR